jgi:hypothetical protein
MNAPRYMARSSSGADQGWTTRYNHGICGEPANESGFCLKHEEKFNKEEAERKLAAEAQQKVWDEQRQREAAWKAYVGPYPCPVCRKNNLFKDANGSSGTYCSLWDTSVCESCIAEYNRRRASPFADAAFHIDSGIC